MGSCYSREPQNLAHSFCLWRLATLQALRRRDQEQFSLRLAEMHQQIANNEETVANAARMLRLSQERVN